MNMTTSFPSVVEAYEQQRIAKAKTNGFAFFAVKGDKDSPAFIYTVGMAQHGLPEILTFCTNDMAQGTGVMMIQLCANLIDGAKQFDVAPLLAALIKTGITVKDPTIHYQPEFLRGDDFKYALKAYTTRAARFHKELGMPKGVLVMNHDGLPTIQQLRAELMFANS